MISKLGSAAFDVMGRTRSAGGPLMSGGAGANSGAVLVVYADAGKAGLCRASVVSDRNPKEEINANIAIRRFMDQGVVITPELFGKVSSHRPWLISLFGRADVAGLDFSRDHEGALNKLNACLAEEVEKERRALEASRRFYSSAIMQHHHRSAQGVYSSSYPREVGTCAARAGLRNASIDTRTLIGGSGDRFHLGVIDTERHPEFGGARYILTLGAEIPADLKPFIR